MEPSTSGSPAAPGFVRSKLLGSGSFGRVNMALDTATGELFAVKSVTCSPQSSQSRAELRAIEREVSFLSTIECPYIVKYLGHSWSMDGEVRTRNLHLELAPGGSLAGLVKSLGPQGLGAPLVRRYTRDVARALCYLHARGVAHRDVKCLNILVGAQGAKLADFGTACHVSAQGGAATCEDASRGLKGSPCWMSPEAVQERGTRSPAVDVWSLGCSVLEMATGHAPWSEVNGGVYGVLYALGRTPSLPQVPEELPADMRDFILSCLQRNPEDRPTAAELLSHPFLAGADSPATDAACGTPGAFPMPRLTRALSGDSRPSSPRGAGTLTALTRSMSPGVSPCPSALTRSPSMMCREARKRRFSRLSIAMDASADTCGSPKSPLLGSTFADSAPCTPAGPAPKRRQEEAAGPEEAPAEAAEFPCEPGEGESATPLFPILGLALLEGRRWAEDTSTLAGSPLSRSVGKWIVVHSAKGQTVDAETK